MCVRGAGLGGTGWVRVSERRGVERVNRLGKYDVKHVNIEEKMIKRMFSDNKFSVLWVLSFV